MRNYEIDYSTSIITVTKKFMKDAGTIGSPAYKEMEMLRKMKMSIVVKETKRRSKTSITYQQMIQYISCVEDSTFYMNRFNAVRHEAASKNNRYQRVKAWFLETFPHFFDKPVFNQDNHIIVSGSDDAIKKLPQSVEADSAA